jgi:hypothetical protein
MPTNDPRAKHPAAFINNNPATVAALAKAYVAERAELVSLRSKTAPRSPAAFINAIAEKGTKEEAVEWLQKTWDRLRQALTLLELARCPNATAGCVDGTIPRQVGEDEWEPEQCQWCHERALISEIKT